jgi:long-chain fatty acid transport protein
MRNRGVGRALLGAAAALAVAWAGEASASAFQLVEQNASGLGNAYAGQAAAAEDASTIFFNPAGMTRLRGLQLVAAVNLVRPTTEFNDGGSQGLAPLHALGGDGGDAGGLSVVPNLYVSWEAWRDVAWAGVGVNVPFGLKTEWDDGWIGRFHALESEVQTINVNPSLAFKVLPWLSIGGGVNWQWINATLSNAVAYSALVGGAPPPLGQVALPLLATCPGATAAGTNCEGVGTVEGDDRSWGWNVGAMADFALTGTRVGVSYRSSIEHELEGNVTFTNVPTVPQLAGFAALFANGDIRADIELPATLSVAVAQEVTPKLQLLADFTWTEWSSISSLDIYRTSGAGLTSTPLEFEDSWRVGLGANYALTDAWKIRGGVAYDRTPVQDEDRTPRLPDEDRTWLAAGAQWKILEQAAIDVGFAYLFVNDAESNLPAVVPPPSAAFRPSARGTLVGDYDANVWIASAQARDSF